MAVTPQEAFQVLAGHPFDTETYIVEREGELNAQKYWLFGPQPGVNDRDRYVITQDERLTIIPANVAPTEEVIVAELNRVDHLGHGDGKQAS